MNGVTVTYPSGALYKTWDDDTRTFTQYTEAGDVEITRVYTAEENYAAGVRATRAADVADDVNARTLLRDALQANAEFLALDPPTTAQVVQQVRLLTRITSALVRWVLRRWMR